MHDKIVRIAPDAMPRRPLFLTSVVLLSAAWISKIGLEMFSLRHTHTLLPVWINFPFRWHFECGFATAPLSHTGNQC